MTFYASIFGKHIYPLFCVPTIIATFLSKIALPSERFKVCIKPIFPSPKRDPSLTPNDSGQKNRYIIYKQWVVLDRVS